MTDAPESEEEEILLVKLVQSAVERQPKVEALAVLHTSAPAAVVSPVPMELKDVPFKEMRFVERPAIVPVAETKSAEEDATPVVVAFPLIWSAVPVSVVPLMVVKFAAPPLMVPVALSEPMVVVPMMAELVVKEVVAVSVPSVREPVLKETVFPVLFKLPENVSGFS
jgi:hypothetical protein